MSCSSALEKEATIAAHESVCPVLLSQDLETDRARPHASRGGCPVKRVMVHCSLTLLLLLVWTGTGLAAPEKMGLVTGGEKGTYYQFGLDLQKLMKQSDFINLTVFPSKGSIENVYAVYQRPGVQLGVVQSDVLAFITRLQSDQTLIKIAKKTRMVFPLYNEEVHVLGRRGIADFEDLTGKRVAIGRDGSGTFLTARLLFQLSDVKPSTMIPIDTDEALAELKAGRIDAMFYVAGYPVKLLKEDVTDKDGLALIPITNKSVLEFYPQAEIPAGTYPWQTTSINTAAVKAVLVSFDFRRRDCDNIGRFAQLMSRGLDSLQKNGHAKWKAVDFNYPLRGWEQYDCVRKALGKTGPSATTPGPARTSQNPVFDAIKGALDQ